MIIKHIPITKKENSNFKRVANYIVSTKGTDNRIARIKITNCESEDIDGAILEVIATQKHNTRSKNDKNYHFIISFKSGEVPSDNILDSIENYVCNALKMSSHQRISAVHTDTDNLHIHVVVNKINKTSFNMIEPYYPYKTFAKCCEYLEQKFNLQLDNHSPVLSVSEAKIKDLEAFTSIGSFVGFIRENFLDDILKAQNWQELHLKLNKKGIVIQQKGNGLVFTNGTLYVKASSVSREISKNRLEKKLGKFIVFNNLNIKKDLNFLYNKKPINFKVDTTNLYTAYKKYQEECSLIRTNRLRDLKLKKEYEKKVIKSKNKIRRSIVKSSKSSVKKFLYQSAYNTLLSNLKNIDKQYNASIAELKKQYKNLSWLEWLQQEAARGNHEAIKALRSRGNIEDINQSNFIYGKKEQFFDFKDKRITVTKSGTIIFKEGNCLVKDYGSSLSLGDNFTKDDLLKVLEISQKKFGNTINIKGTADFTNKILNFVCEKNIPIKFEDKNLEKKRIDLLNKKSKSSEQKINDGISNKVKRWLKI